MSTGHRAKNNKLCSSSVLYQSTYTASGVLAAQVEEGWRMRGFQTHFEAAHTKADEERLFNNPRRIRERKRPKLFQFFENRAKMKVITIRWTCGRIEVNDWISNSLTLGEVTGTRWYLCCMTQALHNYLATTYHFNAYGYLKFYLNTFIFQCPIFPVVNWIVWLIINKFCS